MADYDASFSRGTVFGLTVAEVFILLVFVLLMIFLTFMRQTQQEKQEREARLLQVEQTVSRWRPVTEVFETPEEVLTLTLSTADTNTELNEIRRALQPVIEETSPHELSAGVRNLVERLQETQGQLATTRKDLSLIKKGVNPPCWYEVVTDRGKSREKPLYTFEIGVFEEGVLVRPLPIPQGGTLDDGVLTSFRRDAEVLRLAQLPYDRPLSDQEFLSRFRRIEEAGRGGNVRSYACIFWAKIWDMTSLEAKERWKQAHLNVIEPLFGTYVVRSDSWQSSDD